MTEMTPREALDWYEDLHPPTLAQQLAFLAKQDIPPEPPPGPRYFPPMSAESLVRAYVTMTQDERDRERVRINKAARFVTDNIGGFIV